MTEQLKPGPTLHVINGPRVTKGCHTCRWEMRDEGDERDNRFCDAAGTPIADALDRKQTPDGLNDVIWSDSGLNWTMTGNALASIMTNTTGDIDTSMISSQNGTVTSQQGAGDSNRPTGG